MTTETVSGAAKGVRESLVNVSRRRSSAADGGRVDIVCECGTVVTLAPMHDAKTSPSVIWERSGRASATIPNAWALPAGPLESGGTCAQLSVGPCDACYAARIEAARPAFADLVVRNFQAVRHLLQCVGAGGTGDALAEMVRVSADRQRADGVECPTWRWQADGDIFSAAYANAIRHCALTTSDVEHWVYTRSTRWVRHLTGVPNFQVLVSADEVNLRRAVRAAVQHGLPLAMLANDPDHARMLWDRVSVLDPDGVIPQPIICPAGDASHYGRDSVSAPAHIVGTDGRRRSLERGEHARGACDACRVCLPSARVRRSVTFLLHGGRARRSIVETAVRIRDR